VYPEFFFFRGQSLEELFVLVIADLRLDFSLLDELRDDDDALDSALCVHCFHVSVARNRFGGHVAFCESLYLLKLFLRLELFLQLALHQLLLQLFQLLSF